MRSGSDEHHHRHRTPTDVDAAEHATTTRRDLQYVKIALILGVITALEVGTYFSEDSSAQPTTLPRAHAVPDDDRSSS